MHTPLPPRLHQQLRSSIATQFPKFAGAKPKLLFKSLAKGRVGLIASRQRHLGNINGPHPQFAPSPFHAHPAHPAPALRQALDLLPGPLDAEAELAYAALNDACGELLLGVRSPEESAGAIRMRMEPDGFTLTGSVSGTVQVRLLDALGRECRVTNGSLPLRVGTDGLSPGVYRALAEWRQGRAALSAWVAGGGY